MKQRQQEIKSVKIVETIQKIPAETLVWSECSGYEMTWDEANEWCKKRGGRLPTVAELVRAGEDNIGGFGINRYYWSATTSSSSTPYAWYVNWSHGITGNDTKTHLYYVRCVRLAKI